MSRIILQPLGDTSDNFEHTIIQAVDIKIIEKYVDKELYEKLKEIYPNEKAYIWGVTNGKNNVNKNKWKKIKEGDVTLFAKNKRFIYSAVVTVAFCNKKLAEFLWKTNKYGETWENIYLVDEVLKTDFQYTDFNKLVGYKENNIIQGFTVLDEEKSETVFLSWGLYSDVYEEEVSQDDYSNEIDKLMNGLDLDRPRNGTSRKEQEFLRRILFGKNRVCKCGICGKEYPKELLVAAHIKKRSICSKEERLDVNNIVMPMCKFGCDDLYERGYLLVKDGKIIKNEKKFLTKDLENYIEDIENKTCCYWNEKTAKYFEYHNKMFYEK